MIRIYKVKIFYIQIIENVKKNTKNFNKSKYYKTLYMVVG